MLLLNGYYYNVPITVDTRISPNFYSSHYLIFICLFVFLTCYYLFTSAYSRNPVLSKFFPKSVAYFSRIYYSKNKAAQTNPKGGTYTYETGF